MRRLNSRKYGGNIERGIETPNKIPFLGDMCLFIHISLHAFFCCHLLTVFSKLIFQKILSGTISISNSLDPDQDLGPNCFQVYQQTQNSPLVKKESIMKTFLKSLTDLRA